MGWPTIYSPRTATIATSLNGLSRCSKNVFAPSSAESTTDVPSPFGVISCDQRNSPSISYNRARSHQKWLHMCWLPNRQISVTHNAPYGTGDSIHTSTIRCPSGYCPSFLSIIIFCLATSLHYLHLTSPKIPHITGMVIFQITVPVMPSWHFKRLPVW